MFRNKSAWFSSSVPLGRRVFWKLEGGTLNCWRTADYLFSDNALCPDTLRIFQSQDYLLYKVVVFHSFFLSTCEKRESMKSVPIGHCVLSPVWVQNQVRKVVGGFIWDDEDEHSVTQSKGEVSTSDSETSDTDSSDSGFQSDRAVTEYPSMDSLQRFVGHLWVFHPRSVQCRNCRAHCSLRSALTNLHKEY